MQKREKISDLGIFNLIKRGKWIFAAAAVCLTAGCGEAGEPEPQPEVEIRYHADFGGLDDEALLVEPQEDMEGALEKEKTVITLVTSSPQGVESPFQKVADAFNNESDLYYVELTNYTYGNELGNIRMRLQTEVTAGRGPDIMMEDVIPVNQEMLDQGVLLDMAPYLEASGITPEKYFPAYACLASGDKIYGVATTGDVDLVTINKDMLGDVEAPDLDTLTDILLEYPEKASFQRPGQGAGSIMQYFLAGSEDLWGMVDWEAGKCDFSGELFSKILDVTKRYWEDGEKGYDGILNTVYATLGFYETKETVEARGDVVINFYFDDGCYPKYNAAQKLMINANTKNLDGAWAFVSFVMSKKGQNYFPTPVHRELWAEKMQYYLDLIDAGKSPLNLDQEMIDELEGIYDSAKYYSFRADAVLKIVYEESESYFSGDKTREEVIELIQNRVQLYLDER